MTQQEILVGLGEILDEIEGIPAAEVRPEMSFTSDLDVDSLSMVEIAIAAADRFGTEIPDEHLQRFRTVQDAIDYLGDAGKAA